METEVKTPDLGEGVESARVVGVLVQKGQAVNVDDSIIELETEKAVAEVPSPQAGKVTAIHVKEGDEISTGTKLLTLEADEQREQEPEAQPEATKPPKAKDDKKKPEPAGDDEKPQEQKPRAPHEETYEAPADLGPEEQTPEHEAHRTMAVEDEPEEPAPRTPAPTVERGFRQEDASIPAGPESRRLARELGVELSKVKGTGSGGRIKPDDVIAAARQSKPEVRMEEKEQPAPQAKPTEKQAGEVDGIRTEQLSSIRRAIAQQMAKSAYTLPHVTNFDQADITELEALRESQKKALEERHVKLTLMPFIVRAVVSALRANPVINAMLDLEKQQIVYWQYYNIGIAVDTDRGLVVPVLRHADRLSVVQTAAGVQELAGKVRSGKFDLGLLRDGTFSISNMGSVGGRFSTPIINFPQSAVLLLGRAFRAPVVQGDRIMPRMQLPISLSYDHRLIDGASAARFLNHVIELLEQPTRLLIE